MFELRRVFMCLYRVATCVVWRRVFDLSVAADSMS